MPKVNFDLYQHWETIDEAIDFFLNLCCELTVLKRLPNPPSNPFIRVYLEDQDLTDKQMDKVKVTLEFL